MYAYLKVNIAAHISAILQQFPNPRLLVNRDEMHKYMYNLVLSKQSLNTYAQLLFGMIICNE